MGWNWIVSLAKFCELFVISEGQYRTECELALRNETLRYDTENSHSSYETARGLRNGGVASYETEAEPLTKTIDEEWKKRIHFYWIPVDEETRKKCWNQGDWSFYPRYKEWQKKAAEIARKIIREQGGQESSLTTNQTNQTNSCGPGNLGSQSVRECKRGIDVIHQLNMIGFREPGYLWQVSKETGIPFVWGPIGGLKQFPLAYAEGIKMKAFLWLKNQITLWQIKHDRRVKASLKQASVLIASIPDSQRAIKKYHGFESVLIPETGCTVSKKPVNSESLDLGNSEVREIETTNLANHTNLCREGRDEYLQVLWVGKFDFRKRLDIAIKAIAAIQNPNVQLCVYGTGNEEQVDAAKKLITDLNLEKQVQLKGACSNEEVQAAMQSADVFLFTSVNEDTSTVVLEAISNQLPVVCFDTCGMAAVIDDSVGVKIPLSTPRQSVKDFANVLIDLDAHREKLVEMSRNCREKAEELSWERKAHKMVELYELALRDTKRS